MSIHEPHPRGQYAITSASSVALAPTVVRGRAFDRELPLIRGWISEYRIAESERAEVVRVHRLDDNARQPFAAKVLRSTTATDDSDNIEQVRERILREVVALRALGESGCPNIPRVIAFGVRRETPSQLWYIMPYYARGSMWTAREGGGYWAEQYRGNVDRVLAIAESLATTLAFMHDGPRPCIHGNVDVSNVLFAAPGTQPVLGGFGNARLERSYIQFETEGATATAAWRPPELDRAGVRRLSSATDIFMLGGLIYEAFTGGRRLPPPSDWADSCVHERPEYSLKRESKDPRVDAISLLLRGMLVRGEKRRFSAERVARACNAIRTGRIVPG